MYRPDSLLKVHLCRTPASLADTEPLPLSMFPRPLQRQGTSVLPDTWSAVQTPSGRLPVCLGGAPCPPPPPAEAAASVEAGRPQAPTPLEILAGRPPAAAAAAVVVPPGGGSAGASAAGVRALSAANHGRRPAAAFTSLSYCKCIHWYVICGGCTTVSLHRQRAAPPVSGCGTSVVVACE